MFDLTKLSFSEMYAFYKVFYKGGKTNDSSTYYS